MAEVEHRRRKELIKDMLSKFGNVTVGIHGQELPKFAETEESKYWWKMANMKGTPSVNSRLKLKQNIKYWSKDDAVLLSDVNSEPAPIDDFKREHYPKQKKIDIPEKPNHVL